MVDEEIELDLGLSIGGSFGKPEKLKPVKKVYALTADAESNGFYVYGKENRPGIARDGEHVDLLAKREMHALRRQEAKRKREEKQEIKRGTCRANNGAYRSEWGMEEEPPARKREMTDEQMQMQRQHNGDVANAVPFPAAVQQYPYAPVQYVPFTNGGFPCVMPCWVPGGGTFEPSTWRGFKPYQGNQSLVFNLYNGCEKGEKDGVNGETTSYGSPICGSSAGSEDHSSSHEGGSSSSDSRSRSCPSLVQPQLNGHKANDHTKGHSENSASSEPVESDHDNKVHQSKEKTEAKPSDSMPGLAKETKIDMGKPPKPHTQNQSTPPPPLHRMPYVSTTGNGPNGRTVTGFLYRYSKSEVSIVCVCHGSTFSPAEFVQHAGGTDVSHPLRNITVIPSAFG